ncbi:ras association domain-containing protein 8-like [Astyanax mexicanus]|uniref:Ras association domain-containing protein 8-like n=1 Tax=Astyanax mexicanus TaxID=7994 RepID=A0A8T2LIG9_ASTMX|nr:ras association domain-containing protein 8-like [Astyanax mexicanus]
MEVKVYVEGIQRIVCGVTENTTCQEVVIALAQALGRTGRYTLREKFKEYERNVTPDERLLGSLEKYGQQAREVQLTLQHLGPSLGDWTNKPRAQLRRADVGGRVRRGSGVTGLHRQSLPPLSRLRMNSEPPPEDLKRPKRKSLTLMEEAWGWLENLGRSGKQQLGRDKGKSKEDDKGDNHRDKVSVKVGKIPLASGEPQGRDKKEKNRAENTGIISCLGKHRREDKDKEIFGQKEDEKQKSLKKDQSFDTVDQPELTTIPQERSIDRGQDKAAELELRRLVIQQQASLRELKFKVQSTDEQICQLEKQLEEKQSTSELSEDEEQVQFWLNELKAEEGYEKDLQRQFLELKEKAVECKNKLEDYKRKLQTQATDLTTLRTSDCQQTKSQDEASKGTTAKPLEPDDASSAKEGKAAVEDPKRDSKDKTVITSVEPKLPYILVSANQISESHLSGPAELREWWTRWTEAQTQSSSSRSKTVHRSEITIHLGSTKV